MTGTFTVRNVAGDKYVEAKFLTDASGSFIVSANPTQSTWNLFDTDGNFIGTNTNGYAIVPAGFNINRAIDFGQSLAQENAVASYAAMISAFKPGGWLDLQTNYNGMSGDNIPAFRVGASYILGVAGEAAGSSLDRIKEGGGAVNVLQWTLGSVKDISGDAGNSVDNVRSITAGYQAQQNLMFGPNSGPLPPSVHDQSSTVDESGSVFVSSNFYETGGDPLSIRYTVDAGGGVFNVVLNDPLHSSETYQVVGNTLVLTSDTSTSGVVRTVFDYMNSQPWYSNDVVGSPASVGSV